MTEPSMTEPTDAPEAIDTPAEPDDRVHWDGGNREAARIGAGCARQRRRTKRWPPR